MLGSTATEAQGVFEVPRPTAGSPARRLSAGPPGGVPAADVAEARPFTAPTPAGPVPGLFFAPANRPGPGPAGARPPLVVFCHGGPTSAAEAGFDPVVQFFTSRGLAVAVVDYRGSSGYGRAYRRALDGRWGEADIDDCARYRRRPGRGRVWSTAGRMAIRGTSAGGLTALGALIRSRRFAGAAAWYGVTDLEALAADTHDFESRYVDSLVGPWPEAADTGTGSGRRSITPTGCRVRCSCSRARTIRWCPPTQSRRFADGCDEHRVPCRLTVFAGESHGFRRADTIEASLTAELDFYRSLFGATGRRTATPRPARPTERRGDGRPARGHRRPPTPVVPSTVLTDRLRTHRTAPSTGGERWERLSGAGPAGPSSAGSACRPSGGTPSSTPARRCSPG